jgi:hypothetical protein
MKNAVMDVLQHVSVTSATPGDDVALTVARQPMISLHRPHVDLLKAQLVHLRSYADLRYDRITEINIQMTDLLSFFGTPCMLDLSGRKYALELASVGLELAGWVSSAMKTRIPTIRPIDIEPRVLPIIQTPSHSTFPSGHAVESFTVATLLGKMFPDSATLLDRMAARISTNRIVAGVHVPIDNVAGCATGRLLGAAIAEIAKTGKLTRTKDDIQAVYNPNTGLPVGDIDAILATPALNPDFTYPSVDAGHVNGLTLRKTTRSKADAPAPTLQALWTAAMDEDKRHIHRAAGGA